MGLCPLFKQQATGRWDRKKDIDLVRDSVIRRDDQLGPPCELVDLDRPCVCARVLGDWTVGTGRTIEDLPGSQQCRRGEFCVIRHPTGIKIQSRDSDLLRKVPACVPVYWKCLSEDRGQTSEAVDQMR